MQGPVIVDIEDIDHALTDDFLEAIFLARLRNDSLHIRFQEAELDYIDIYHTISDFLSKCNMRIYYLHITPEGFLIKLEER